MDLFSALLFILFATAIVDLIVGVSNDAVNFLNSAIGSRVASFRTILIIASLGILLGSTFSSGMMEIARNGLFNPGFFTFREVMYIFLAVMLTDIILLDMYNDLGLPTSTTVSLVFELLGAATMAGILVWFGQHQTLADIPFREIINYSSAITIVTGIFLSIFLAFLFGTVIQHISRIAFTFSLNKSIQKYGALFSGLSITTITYFLLIKGAKGSSFISDAQIKWVMANVWAINLGMLVFWSILIQFLMWWRNINPLKIVVLMGTFALAMAFAGNDLVNFIGVAVGGLTAFQVWQQSGISADTYHMEVLSGRFDTPTWILLVAGGVMILTLWTNAKSRKVTETEVSLGRQDEGEEKFKPNWISRSLVGASIFLGKSVQSAVPKSLTQKLEARFAKVDAAVAEKDRPSFDLVRASVNLLVSSVLIAFGTSMKLPLSTTFVTFMVAMGSSFADQAWGRESAVYRVAGVTNVIAGWLITAIMAFAASATLAFVLFKTGIPGAFVLAGLAAFLLIRSHLLFARKAKREAATSQLLESEVGSLTQAIDESKELTVRNLQAISKAYSTSVESLIKEKKSVVAKSLQKIKELGEQNDKVQGKIIKYVRKMPKNNLAASRLYVLMFDYMQDLYQSTQLINESCANHLENFHSSPSKEYLKSLAQLERRMIDLFEIVAHSIGKTDYTTEPDVKERYQTSLQLVNETIDREIDAIQRSEVGSRIGLLQMRLLLETKDIFDSVFQLFHLYCDYHRQEKK